MKNLLFLFTFLLAVAVQGQVCANSWNNQNTKHIDFFRSKLAETIQEILIDAYSRVGVSISSQNISFSTTITSNEMTQPAPTEGRITTNLTNSDAVVTIDGQVTEFLVQTYSKNGNFAESRSWSVYTSGGERQNFSAIGDLISYSCETIASPMAFPSRVWIESFVVKRKSNQFLIGMTYPFSYQDSTEEIK